MKRYRVKRPNATGRNQGDSKYTCLYRWVHQSPAWRSLSLGGRCLLIELMALYNGGNNGSFYLSVREGARRVGVAPNTATKLFKELQDRGFIRCAMPGSFGRKKRHATTWILTEYEYAGALATKDFMRWQPEPKIEKRYQGLRPMVAAIETEMSQRALENGGTVANEATVASNFSS